MKKSTRRKMKKRSLFICNSIYQVLVAHWIQYHYLKGIPADIWISDRVSKGKDIVARVSQCNLFQSSSYIESKEFLHEYFACKGKRCREIWYRSKRELEKFTRINNIYSELYIANFDYFDQLTYNALTHFQKNAPKLIMFEDGIGTYQLLTKKNYETLGLPFRKWEQIICNKLFGCIPVYGNLNAAILFTPKDMQWNPCDFIKLDPIREDDKKFLEIINHVFDYKSNEEGYKRKYIFFEQCFDVDGLPVNDVELLNQIALRVGKENIMVKLHQRSVKNRFVEHGFLTNKNRNIPWEVIAMNMDDLSEKVFITVGSGCALNLLRVFNKKVKIYLLQKLIIWGEEAPLKITRILDEGMQNLASQYSDDVVMCDSIDQIPV